MLEFLTPEMIAFIATFFFVFALVFALLVKTKLFQESKGAVAAIAVVIGLVTAVYQPVSAVILTIMPFAALILVAIFFLIFIRELFKENKEKKDVWPMVVCIAIMLMLLNAFWDKIAGYFGFTLISAENMLWIIGILLIVVIFYAAYSVWGGEEKATT